MGARKAGVGAGMSLPYFAVWILGTGAAYVLDAVAHGVLLWWIVGTGSAYLVSLYLHPNRNCWKCKGSARHTGAVVTYARRRCTGCDGSGRRLRLGNQLLGINGLGNNPGAR